MVKLKKDALFFLRLLRNMGRVDSFEMTGEDIGIKLPPDLSSAEMAFPSKRYSENIK